MWWEIVVVAEELGSIDGILCSLAMRESIIYPGELICGLILFKLVYKLVRIQVVELIIVYFAVQSHTFRHHQPERPLALG
jgi:hypothetical protein